MNLGLVVLEGWLLINCILIITHHHIFAPRSPPPSSSNYPPCPPYHRQHDKAKPNWNDYISPKALSLLCCLAGLLKCRSPVLKEIRSKTGILHQPPNCVCFLRVLCHLVSSFAYIIWEYICVEFVYTGHLIQTAAAANSSPVVAHLHLLLRFPAQYRLQNLSSRQNDYESSNRPNSPSDTFQQPVIFVAFCSHEKRPQSFSHIVRRVRVCCSLRRPGPNKRRRVEAIANIGRLDV